MGAYLVEEHLGFPEDVLQLGQLEVVPLESLGVLVYLAKLIFQLLKRGLTKHLVRLEKDWFLGYDWEVLKVLDVIVLLKREACLGFPGNMTIDDASRTETIGNTT